jgi:hypothetical protein
MLQSFEQLAGTPGSALQAAPANARDVVLWLKQAQRKLKDAGQVVISEGTRMDAAWDAVLFACLAVACAEGWRATAEKGHHVVVLTGAVHALGLGQKRFDELDTLRDWRNRKYRPGQQVQPEEVVEAIALVEPFLEKVGAWFAEHYGVLIKQGQA